MVVGSDLEEVEQIFECIRVAHPGVQRATLPEFIDSIDEVVEDLADKEQQRTLDTYERAPLYEEDSEANDTPDDPIQQFSA